MTSEETTLTKLQVKVTAAVAKIINLQDELSAERLKCRSSDTDKDNIIIRLTAEKAAAEKAATAATAAAATAAAEKAAAETAAAAEKLAKSAAATLAASRVVTAEKAEKAATEKAAAAAKELEVEKGRCNALKASLESKVALCDNLTRIRLQKISEIETKLFKII